MELEDNHGSRDELWQNIETLLSSQCDTHDEIDNVLRSYLVEVEAHDVDADEDSITHCAYLLYTSLLFADHAAYVRRQLVHVLLQDDTPCTLHITTTFLLADARENEHLFDLFNKEGCFPRLVELIAQPRLRRKEQHIHRQLMELMYEMSRIQRITNDDLMHVTDDFIRTLFEIIEQVSNDVNDPYHYPVIRVLLVLNEQFMVAAHDPAAISLGAVHLTNKVIKVLAAHGHECKTFGANLILLLNREDETSLQLLTLKLMYLLFTTPSTYEYFYLNDLRVLVDILIRNLLDLPEYAAALRHTYLRVLYPLLEHTQLQHPPYYKRDELRNLLSMLCGEYLHNDDGDMHWNHFEDVDETTKRLVKRCRTVSWLYDAQDDLIRVGSPIDLRPTSPDSSSSPTKPKPPVLPPPRKLRKRDSSKSTVTTAGGFLTPNIDTARQSSLSMMAMAEQKEKPGVITPSRNPSMKYSLRKSIFSKPEKPPLPKARRSGLARPKPESVTTELEVSKARLPERTQTPESERTEATDRFEDAHEFQLEQDFTPVSSVAQTASSMEGLEPSVLTTVFSANSQIIPQGPAESANRTQSTSISIPSISLPQDMPSDPPPKSLSHPPAMLPSKKPPPAPKARRGWRMRSRTTEEKAPGKFSVTLPSIATNVSSPDLSTMTQSPEGLHGSLPPVENPFSPEPGTKTLDPMTNITPGAYAAVEHAAAATAAAAADEQQGSNQQHEKKDVREALAQAQAQAVEEVENMVHDTHLDPPLIQHEGLDPEANPDPEEYPNQGPSSTEAMPPIPERVILAPPSSVIRGVPGPRVELEKSPFLSDDDDDDDEEEDEEEEEGEEQE